MGDTLKDLIQREGKMLNEAVHNISPLKKTGNIKDAHEGFKAGSITNQVAVLSGGVSGMTLMLKGFRDMKNGCSKKNPQGKRDLVNASLGFSQVLGGLLLTATFYERLKIGGKAAGDQGPQL